MGSSLESLRCLRGGVNQLQYSWAFFVLSTFLFISMNINLFYAGCEEYGDVQTIRIMISDEDFLQYAQLNVKFMKKELRVVRSKTLQVFPDIPSDLSTNHLTVSSPITENKVTFSVKSGPSHGSLSQPTSEAIDDSIMTYNPKLTDHLTRKLCRDLSRISVSDKFTLVARDEELDIEKSVVIRVNISFLNYNNNTLQALGMTSPSIHVVPGERVIVSSGVINAGRVADILDGCNSGIELGFLIRDPPSDCRIEGLDAAAIAWWQQVTERKITISCDETDLSSKNMILRPMILQNGFIFDMENSEFPLTIQSAQNSKPAEIETRQLFLMQGVRTVKLKINHFSDTSGEQHIYTVLSDPINGRLRQDSADITAGSSFTTEDIHSRRISYTQLNMEASSDQFQLHVYSQTETQPKLKLVVEILVKPNVQSSEPFVIFGLDPISLTLKHLDASPLRQYTSGDIIYNITKQPSFGQLRRKNSKLKRSINSSSVKSFSHEDVRSEVILYYPPDHFPSENSDYFTYTLMAEDTQPADGVFSVTFTEPIGLADSPTQSPVQQSSVVEEAALTILLAVICVLICSVTLVITVLCLRRVHRKKKRLARRALLNSEPRLILAKENGSYKLLVAGSGDFPGTPISSPPSPCHLIDPDKEPEISTAVPEVRVTPLLQTDGTCYDLHDYVNCEDLPSYRSRLSFSTQKSSQESSTDINCDKNDSLNEIYSSFEHLPPIKKPQYSC